MLKWFKSFNAETQEVNFIQFLFFQHQAYKCFKQILEPKKV